MLFTDIEGSTAHLRRLGDDAYARVLADHHELIRDRLRKYGGIEVGTQGDSFFAVFASPIACVESTVDMQRGLISHVWPAGRQLRVRMGIHTGEVLEDSTGLVGYEVHRAARIAAVANGGQILVSTSTAALVRDALPPGVTLRNLGTHRLKDLGGPEVLFQLVVDGIASEFPQLRSLDNPELPNNLPASLSPFVGRVKEVAEIRALVESSKLVTLTGTGGAGKTRLALQVAAELLDGSGEGVWFVELAPIGEPDQVASAVIDTLELHQENDRSVLESLAHALRDQAVLIVLDNCEQVIDAVAKLTDVLVRSCPKVHIVATSREPLGVDGEETYPVLSLSLPSLDVEGVEDLEGADSVDLFLARAWARDKTFQLVDSNARLVASVCRRLDGIPLAIELAAARLSSMSLGDLHDRLDQRFQLLTGGSRTVLPRHQTLAATVAWSYDLLNGPEQATLRRLSVFVSGFDLKGAESVCTVGTVETFEVVDLVSSLVNKNLITAERGPTTLRYRLLETIRQYAAEALVREDGERERAEVERRHATHYLRVCEEAEVALRGGPDQIDWLNRLDGEWGNLQASFAHFAADPDGVESVLRLGTSGYEFFATRLLREPIAYLREALARGCNAGPELRCRALLVVASLLRRMPPEGVAGETYNRLGRDLCGEALELARIVENVSLESEILAALSLYTRDLGEATQALGLAERARELARLGDDPLLIGIALWAVGLNQPSRDQGRPFIVGAADEFRRGEQFCAAVPWAAETLFVRMVEHG